MKWLIVLPSAVFLLAVTARAAKYDTDNGGGEKTAASGGKENADVSHSTEEGDKPAVVHVAKSHAFTYHSDNGPQHWPVLFNQSCNGVRQSPINILTYNAKTRDDLNDWTFWYDPPRLGDRMYLVNNGHTAKVELEGEFYITGGGLDDVMKAAQLHFHWGVASVRGSEHYVNGKPHPLEMHIVTYDSERFDSLGEAVAKGKESLAVLAVMFNIQEEDNPILNPITSRLANVIHPDPDNRVEIPVFSLRKLAPKDTSVYYRYQGSLTTPNCNEIVTWSIFAQTLGISEAQLKLFTQLHANPIKGRMTKLVDNWRPLQPLNNRVVYRSFEADIKMAMLRSGSSNMAAAMLVTMATTMTAIFCYKL